MIKLILFDFSRTLLFPRDSEYTKSLNRLHSEHSQEDGYVFESYFAFNDELLQLCRKLKSKYTVSIFTTGLVQNAPEIRNTLIDIFENIYSVPEVGFEKTDPRSYTYISKVTKIEPSEILFIDDQIDNIKAADIAGFKTINFLNNTQLFNDMKNYIDIDNLESKTII